MEREDKETECTTYVVVWPALTVELACTRRSRRLPRLQCLVDLCLVLCIVPIALLFGPLRLHVLSLGWVSELLGLVGDGVQGRDGRDL
jgi:hypothetical protein